ncbi:hypothetical protein [Streptomyces sp.]|uniref:hypothetical protein n=1 Tax=Streptomyces sp. TaxID=1931 RepID=UPI002D4AB558|nr:hypothetical protein [Streptomyces sp.]HZF90257.1 hypothetical protein [Streptomyces sp.]
MGGAKAVSWGETALVLMGCWALCALGYGVVWLLDDPTLPAAAPAVMALGHWFWRRHRSWPAAALAAVAGAAVLFWLLDSLRPRLDRITADALSTGAGVLAALVVFTVVSRACTGLRHG